jgi:hypothetical protein
MADVVISYSRENAASARLLADTLAKDGYEVWRDESAAPSAAGADAIAEQIGRAGAVIVLWSESANASEWVRAEANVARGMKKLVQASADDQPPPIPFDPATVASVWTWLGEPDHPGWQQIRAGVVALCGAPASEKTVLALAPAPSPAAPAGSEPSPVSAAPSPVAAPEPVAPSIAEPAPVPSPAPQPATAVATPAGRGKGGLIAAILLLLVVLGGGGYWAWQQGWIALPGAGGGSAPADELTSALPPGPGAPATPPTETVQAPAAMPQPSAPANETGAVEEQFTQESVVRNAEGFAFVRSAPGGEGLTIARVNAGDVFTTYPQEGEWWRVRTASGATGYMAASSIRARAVVQAETRAAEERRRRPTGPRINRANSENMRLFCQNAGQGTSQCRRFRQQVRDQRR